MNITHLLTYCVYDFTAGSNALSSSVQSVTNVSNNLSTAQGLVNGDAVPASAAELVNTESQVDEEQWKNNSFFHPLRLLTQQSGFPNLYVLYNILCCLPVSSASAERAMSKLKIIKNRLRTSLADETMSALMILAADIMLGHYAPNR